MSAVATSWSFEVRPLGPGTSADCEQCRRPALFAVTGPKLVYLCRVHTLDVVEYLRLSVEGERA